MARNGFGHLLQELGVVDRVFEIEKKDRLSYQAVGEELRKNSFEWIFCPHLSVTSARLIWPLKAEKKIGFIRFWNSIFFTDRVAKPLALPEALRQMSILNPVDPERLKQIAEVQAQTLNIPAEKLPPPPAWARADVSLPAVELEPGAKAIAIFPGSVWETKKWTQEGFLSLAHRFEAEGYLVLLLGSKTEFEVCAEIQKNCQRALNLAGKNSLLETLKILKGAKLVISNDSGGSHLASLSATPTLSIFGPTVIEQGFRPWVERGAVVSLESLACRPCGAHGHQKCPIGTHECMKGLSAEKVFSVAKGLL